MNTLLVIFVAAVLLQTISCQAASRLIGVAGRWTFEDGALRLVEADSDWSLAVSEDQAGDLTVETELVWHPVGTPSRAGVVFRYKDAKNFAVCALVRQPYRAWNGKEDETLHTIAFYQVVDGKEELTNVTPWMDYKEGRHRLKVKVAGSQVLAELDNRPVLQGQIFPSLVNGKAGVAARYSPATFLSVTVAPTPLRTQLYGVGNVRHDSAGRVLPRWPYKWMIIRPVEFALWAAEHAAGNWLEDEEGHRWPCYVGACTIYLNGTVGNPTNYPPQEFSFYNNGFLDYYQFTGDRRALERAEELARWLMMPAHITPSSWPYGNLACTKTVHGKAVGDIDGKRIFLWPYGEVGQIAQDSDGKLISLEEQGAVACTILRLYHLTNKKAYLDYATGIADTLVRRQLPEGNWHYRVNPQTGKPNSDFTANVIDNILLLKEMWEITGKLAYRVAAEKAERWLLECPIKSNRWLGIFGDVPSNVDLSWAENYKGPDKENYAPFVAQNAARYLLSLRQGQPGYVRIAQSLRKWILDHFLGKDSNGEIGIAEQSVCFHVMPYHGFHQAMLEADLYEATGNDEYRQMAFHLLNSGMYQTEWNGFIHLLGGGLVQGGCDTWWCNILWAPTGYLYAMATFPEMAPSDENHLLRTSAPLTFVRYQDKTITYGTARESRDRLVVRSRPKHVYCAGRILPALRKLGNGYAWSYESRLHALDIYHPAGRVRICL